MRKLSFLVLFAVMVVGCNDVVAPEDLTMGFELDVYVDDQLVASYEGPVAEWRWSQFYSGVGVSLGSYVAPPEPYALFVLCAPGMDAPFGTGGYPIGHFSFDPALHDPVSGIFAGWFGHRVLVESTPVSSQYETTDGSFTVTRVYPDEDGDWIQGEVSLEASYFDSYPPLDEAPNAIRIQGSFTAQHQRRFPQTANVRET